MSARRTYDITKPDDYTEAPDGVDCPDCTMGTVDLGDGPYGQPQIHYCSTCYGTGRVPEPDEPEDWDPRISKPGGDGHALAATVAAVRAVTLDPTNDDPFNLLGKKPEPLTDTDALSIRDGLRPHLRGVFGDGQWDWDRVEVYAVRANKQAADEAAGRLLTTFGDRPYLSVHTDPTAHDRRRWAVVMAPAREVSNA